MSTYFPGIGSVAPNPRPAQGLPLDPPEDDILDRERFEESRWDDLEAMADDWTDALGGIFGDETECEAFLSHLRDRDFCAIGLMLKCAADRRCEEYVGDHLDELRAKRRDF